METGWIITSVILYLLVGALITLIKAFEAVIVAKSKGEKVQLSERERKISEEAPSGALFLIALTYESIVWLPKLILDIFKALKVIWKHRKRG